MAQADQTIQNNTFPAVRADINNNLAALFTNNSGSVEPAVRVAYMDWIDTSDANPVWRKRNSANTAWLTVGTFISGTLALAGTGAVDSLPSQTGQSGRYLTTNGTNASWDILTNAALASGTANNTTFLRGDRTWQTITTTPTTTQVLNATAGLTAGQVGSYAFLQRILPAGGTSLTFNAGATESGANLRFAGVSSLAGGIQSSGTPSGTWRIVGYSVVQNVFITNGQFSSSSMWVRIS